MYKVSPHGKLPVPNNEDYNIDPNTYELEFFQEVGLEGSFVIDLIEAVRMEVDTERFSASLWTIKGGGGLTGIKQHMNTPHFIHDIETWNFLVSRLHYTPHTIHE